MEELKTCPFCGKPGLVQIDDDGFLVVGCDSQDCVCNIYEAWKKQFTTEEKAIDAWNRRTEYDKTSVDCSV